MKKTRLAILFEKQERQEEHQEDLFLPMNSEKFGMKPSFQKMISPQVISRENIIENELDKMRRELLQEVQLDVNLYWDIFNENNKNGKKFRGYVGPTASVRGKSLNISWHYYERYSTTSNRYIKKGTVPSNPRYRKDSFDDFAGWEIDLANETEDVFSEYRKIWSCLNKMDRQNGRLNRLIKNKARS